MKSFKFVFFVVVITIFICSAVICNQAVQNQDRDNKLILKTESDTTSEVDSTRRPYFQSITGYMEGFKHDSPKDFTESGNSATQYQGRFRYTCYITPREIYWGDTVYYAIYVDNLNDFSLSCHTDKSLFAKINGDYSKTEGIDKDTCFWWNRYFSSHDVAILFLTGQEYKPFLCEVTSRCPFWYSEGQNIGDSGEPIKPQYSRCAVAGQFEILPIPDLKNKSWQQLNENQDVQCNIRFSYFDNKIMCNETIISDTQYGYGHLNIKQTPLPYLSFKFNIAVKKRPKVEDKLLTLWTEKFPFEMIPVDKKIDRTRGWICPLFENDETRKTYLATKKKAIVTLRNQSFSLWDFQPWYKRKPGYPYAPTTIQGWRDLESSLVPSTMRDEIQMTRMLLEYYDASGEQQDQKLAEIKTWLESLPEVQSSILARYYNAPKDSPLYESAQKIKPVIEKFTDTKDRPIPVPVQINHAIEIKK